MLTINIHTPIHTLSHIHPGFDLKAAAVEATVEIDLGGDKDGPVAFKKRKMGGAVGGGAGGGAKFRQRKTRTKDDDDD